MSKSDAQSEKLIVGDVAVKPDGEKLQKVLARMGLGSRRKLPGKPHPVVGRCPGDPTHKMRSGSKGSARLWHQLSPVRAGHGIAGRLPAWFMLAWSSASLSPIRRRPKPGRSAAQTPR